MAATYVPILQWKRGEKVGFSNVRATHRVDVLPLFVLGTKQFVGKKATKKKPSVDAPGVVARELHDLVGTTPFYLDAVALPDSAAGHPLADIAVKARAIGLNMIPAGSWGGSPAYFKALKDAHAADGRGALLRVDLQQFSTAATWAPTWPIPLAQTDLLADFADNVATVAALGPALTTAFSTLHVGATWRRVLVGGTSLPKNFQGYAAGLHTIRRHELALWRSLAGAGLPFALHFADYATVPIGGAPTGIAWGYPINVKYTLANEFLVCRGVGTTRAGGVDMDVQLVKHAKDIVAYPGRGPLVGNWADAKIDAIAGGHSDPQGLEHWVQLGVCRHVEFTRTQIP